MTRLVLSYLGAATFVGLLMVGSSIVDRIRRALRAIRGQRWLRRQARVQQANAAWIAQLRADRRVVRNTVGLS